MSTSWQVSATQREGFLANVSRDMGTLDSNVRTRLSLFNGVELNSVSAYSFNWNWFIAFLKQKHCTVSKMC